MAASLGIPAWRIKTVAVYEGSVIVLFDIFPDPSFENPLEELKNVGESIKEILSNTTEDILGAPLLDLDVMGESIIRSTDSSGLNNKGTSTLIADWLAERDRVQTDDSKTGGATDGSTDGGSTSNGDGPIDGESGESGTGGDDGDLSVI